VAIGAARHGADVAINFLQEDAEAESADRPHPSIHSSTCRWRHWSARCG
jgi:hypothetical protein